MSRGQNRAERLKEMERLYIQRAYTDIELAERLQVTRTTVYKDRILLETQFPFTQDANGRYRIDRSRYISEIHVNLYEALSLYLAARRASRQLQLAGPHAASGLEKLASALRQPMTQRLVRAADAILAQKRSAEHTAVLETIACAWVENTVTRIVYRALETAQSKTHHVKPYLIEPSHWSDSSYLIGESDRTGKIYPFKIERIERATLTMAHFEPPADFDEQTLLRHAWGIWYAEHEPVRVQLRFAPGRATRRLKESVWHPTEVVTDTDDGGCLWQADVAEWQEMLPWIRGWGADCEVLEPTELKGLIVRQVREMMKQYGLQMEESDQKTISSSLVESPKTSAPSGQANYIVDNSGPTVADDVSPELMELFDEFMNVGDNDE